MRKAILFDLDGTLTESGEGIIKSVQHALGKMRRPEPEQDKLRVFIGPPLTTQFMAYAGFTREEAEKAVAFYRERYSTVGLFENRPYPGIPEMLRVLREHGYLTAVASSKPEKFVRQILDHFAMTDLFDEIVGATFDEKRTEKKDVVLEALRRLDMLDARDQVLMVGDKEHDVFGAREEGLACIAVAYGYGSMEELTAAQPFRIVNTVEELQQALLEF